MTSLDILYIVLAVCALFLSIPLMMILWRAYATLGHVEQILNYINHLRELALRFESVPMKFIESILSSVSKEKETESKKK